MNFTAPQRAVNWKEAGAVPNEGIPLGFSVPKSKFGHEVPSAPNDTRRNRPSRGVRRIQIIHERLVPIDFGKNSPTFQENFEA